MEAMFHCAVSFNGDLSGWDVSKVTNALDMFANCPIPTASEGFRDF
jgi:surface protein